MTIPESFPVRLPLPPFIVVDQGVLLPGVRCRRALSIARRLAPTLLAVSRARRNIVDGATCSCRQLSYWPPQRKEQAHCMQAKVL
jgi:hypothetical protein